MANYKKNLELLKNHLDRDEEIVASVFGAYETKVLGNDSVRNGVMAATSKRLVFYAKKLGGHDFESFPYSNISSIESGKAMMGKTLGFFASGNKVTMKWISAGNLPKLVARVRSHMGEGVTSAPAPRAAVADPEEDFAAKIRKLAELHGAGILTDEEFASKKAEILARV